MIACSVIGLCAFAVIGAAVWIILATAQKGTKNIAGGYLIENGKVIYYSGLSGFGAPQSREITEADAATFKVIEQDYATDKNNAYLDGRIIPQSDGASFKVLRKPYAADRNHVFYNDAVLSDAPKNFKFIVQNPAPNDRETFSTDGAKVFYGAKAIFPETIDAATFAPVGSTRYFKDKNHVYTLEKIIEGADSDTFEVVPGYLEKYAKDKKSVFYDGVKVENCDAATHKILNENIHTDARHVFYAVQKFSDDPANFEILASDYSKDAKNIYWKSSKISGADTTNFKVFATENTFNYAKDGKSVFWCDKKLDKADAATFVGLSNGYGKDKTNVWFGLHQEDQPEIVANADAATFEIYKSDTAEARDKNNNFKFGAVTKPNQ